jgi:hypothetical protein
MSNATVVNWNAEIPFPSDSCFKNRIISAKFAPSNKGHQMITLELEVVEPATYPIGDQEVNIAGVKAKMYFITKMFDENGNVDESKTANCRSRVFVSANPEKPSLYDQLGLDGAAADPENPNVSEMLGKVVYTQMSSEPTEQRKTPTADEIAKAKKAGTRPVGAVMKHPKTGKPLVKYWPKIDEIFGLVD